MIVGLLWLGYALVGLVTGRAVRKALMKRPLWHTNICDMHPRYANTGHCDCPMGTTLPIGAVGLWPLLWLGMLTYLALYFGVFKDYSIKIGRKPDQAKIKTLEKGLNI